MSHLITLENISQAFGAEILLDRVKLQIEKGERVCLIGRNGAGKSTLLKIIEGTLQPDDGIVLRKNNLRIAKLSQELPQNLDCTVLEFVTQGLAEIGELLSSYHAVAQRVSDGHQKADLAQLEQLQHLIDAQQGWNIDRTVQRILSQLQLNPAAKINELSGGWQRRAALAKTLVNDPELLLLDEPTNHLDIEAIQWLEDQIIGWNMGIIFITHDRALLQRLATRILELDRGQLTSWPGDYANFLRRKAEMLHAEAKQHALFDKKLTE